MTVEELICELELLPLKLTVGMAHHDGIESIFTSIDAVRQEWVTGIDPTNDPDMIFVYLYPRGDDVRESIRDEDKRSWPCNLFYETGE